MRDLYVPLPTFIDTTPYGVVPKLVVWPGVTPHAPAPEPHPEPPQGEPLMVSSSNHDPGDSLDALRATIDAIAHEARWQGPPRELPLEARAAGSRTVRRLNAAIAAIALRLAADPLPSHRLPVNLAEIPTGILVALADLRPVLGEANRALLWLEERRARRRAARDSQPARSGERG